MSQDPTSNQEHRVVDAARELLAVIDGGRYPRSNQIEALRSATASLTGERQALEDELKRVKRERDLALKALGHDSYEAARERVNKHFQSQAWSNEEA